VALPRASSLPRPTAPASHAVASRSRLSLASTGKARPQSAATGPRGALQPSPTTAGGRCRVGTADGMDRQPLIRRSIPHPPCLPLVRGQYSSGGGRWRRAGVRRGQRLPFDHEIWSNREGGSVSSTTVSPSCGISRSTAFTTASGESPAGKTTPSMSELRIRLVTLDCVAASNG
jgi:hypothetical protein